MTASSPEASALPLEDKQGDFTNRVDSNEMLINM